MVVVHSTVHALVKIQVWKKIEKLLFKILDEKKDMKKYE